MVKLKGPMFSLKASGSIGGCITYQSNGGLSIAKSLRFYTIDVTPNRQRVRDIWSWSFSLWYLLNPLTQALWNAYKDVNNISGIRAFQNAFMRRFWLGLPEYEIPPTFGYCAVGEYKVDEFLVDGAFIPFPG
jgi:hypothetical protein